MTQREDVGLNGIATLRRAAAARLSAAGVDSPDLDARLLLEAATGLDAAALAAADRPLSPDEAARFDALLARRLARAPLSQILGRAGFWTVELAVTPDVLTPRPDTETVLEAALAETAGKPAGRALDLGVGPGTLLLAFLHERSGWTGIGVDASAAALAVARTNVAALGLGARASLVLGDWDAAVGPHARFDLLLCNPPYVASAEIATLAPEVRDHEPRLALDGGADGLDVYRRLAPALPRLLAPDGVAVFEIGADQGPRAAAIFAAALPGARVRVVQDLERRERVVVVRLEPPA